MVRRLFSLGAIAALVLIAFLARADVPPLEGWKRVPYAIRVDGLKGYPEHVILAFPYSTSDGAPTEEHARLEDGKRLGVGSRSATPKLYAMKRVDYEAWLKTYVPPDERWEDKALRALFASGQVHACNATLTPTYEIDEDDARNEVVEAFRVSAIDDQRCNLDRLTAPESKSNPRRGGCAGCTAGPAPRLDAWSILALAGALWMRARLRRRELDESRRSRLGRTFSRNRSGSRPRRLPHK